MNKNIYFFLEIEVNTKTNLTKRKKDTDVYLTQLLWFYAAGHR